MTLRFGITASIVGILALTSALRAQTQDPKLIKSLSGPSGQIVGSQFQFDETRNRFVYPQDKTLTVYFEWTATPGDHVLTATWKQPDGRVASVSPDVRIKTTTPQLNSFWIFSITPALTAGAWTVEIRIDGQPAGSHAFELAGVSGTGDLVTLDWVFRTYGPAVVRLHKIDEAGRRFDTSSGFVIGANAIATAFQSIDSAARLEIEFADGRKATTDSILAFSRQDDWAIVKADTGALTAIPLSDAQTVPVGSHLAAFSVDGGSGVVVPVSVGGFSAPGGYGTRIRFTPDVSRDALGGPLIDEHGKVVGVLGGSLTPGSRFGQRLMTDNPWMFNMRPEGTTATFVRSGFVAIGNEAKPIGDLQAGGFLTPVPKPMVEYISGGTATTLPTDSNSHLINDRLEFSASGDKQVIVYAFFQKRTNVPKGQTAISKGEVSATVFDVSNKARAAATPLKVTLKTPPDQLRVNFSFPTASLPIGYYRIDVFWDGAPAWRTYIRIVD